MNLNDELIHSFIEKLTEVEKQYRPFVLEAADPYRFAPDPIMEPDPELEYNPEEEMEQRDVPQPMDYSFRPPPVDPPIQGPPKGVVEPDPELEYSSEEEMEERDNPDDPHASLNKEEAVDLITRNPLHAILNLRLYREPQYQEYTYLMLKSLMTLIEVNPGQYLEDRSEEIKEAATEMMDILEQDIEVLEEKKNRAPVQTGTSEWSPSVSGVETGTSEWKI